ncbi:hypothetical protein GCM10023068_10170 [Leifsonia shinshuensis]
MLDRDHVRRARTTGGPSLAIYPGASVLTGHFTGAWREPMRIDPPGLQARFAFLRGLPYAYASVVIEKRKRFETIRPHRLVA